MAIEGELQGVYGTTCTECGRQLELGVYSSMAGYYLGYWCGECGPEGRETDYFRTHEEAERALKRLTEGRPDPSLRDTDYKGR